MAKEKIEPKLNTTMRPLTISELEALSVEIINAGSVSAFLQEKGILEFDRDGNSIAVKSYTGLGGANYEAIPDTGILIESDVPWNTWKEIMKQYDYYIKSRIIDNRQN